MKVGEWYIEDNGHSSFENIALHEKLPKHIIIEETSIRNNTDGSDNREAEEIWSTLLFSFSLQA